MQALTDLNDLDRRVSWVDKVESSGTYEQIRKADHGACLGHLNAGCDRICVEPGLGGGDDRKLNTIQVSPRRGFKP